MKVVGLDIGTSGAKGLVVEFPSGRVVDSHRAGYRLHGGGVIAEQEPEDWVRAARAILGRFLRRHRLEGIGLDGQMHSEVVLDGDGRPRGRSILWCDGRAQPQCEQIERKIGLARLKRTVANRPFAGFTLPHLLWRRQNGERVGTVAVCKDYGRFRLTGELRHEMSDAAGTLCWNVSKGEWAEEIPRALGLSPTFPKACGSAEVAGRHRGVPVVGGAADNPAAAVGLGTVRAGLAHVSMGTSNVLFACTDRPRVDSKMRVHTMTHAVPGRFYLMGCMLTGTRALDWVTREMLGWPLARALERAARIPAGCEGLIFAPYLVGERTPHADTTVRGLFAGLEPRHTGAHLVRAVIEGTAFALREALDVVREAGVKVREVRVTGGGMKSALWRQVVADALGVDVVTVSTSDEGAAYGAAILAAAGVGSEAVEKICDGVVRETSRTRPRGDYEPSLRVFRNAYPAASLLRAQQIGGADLLHQKNF